MVRLVTRTGPIDRCSNPDSGGLNNGILVSDDAIDSDHDACCRPGDDTYIFNFHSKTASDCLKGDFQVYDESILHHHSSADSGPCDSLYDVSVISACPFAPQTPAPQLLRRSKDNRSRRNCNGVHYRVTWKKRLRLLGLLLMLNADTFWPHVTAYANDCQPNQLFDQQRVVCLDRCGSDNELICPVEHICSSNQRWSRRYDPPLCVNRCVYACDKTSYCDHDSATCRPCTALCDGSNMAACRAYCYGVFLNVTSLETQTTNDPAPITSANNPVLSAKIITSVKIYHMIVGVLSAIFVFLIGVLAITHYRESRFGSPDSLHDSENNGAKRTLMQA